MYAFTSASVSPFTPGRGCGGSGNTGCVQVFPMRLVPTVETWATKVSRE